MRILPPAILLTVALLAHASLSDHVAATTPTPCTGTCFGQPGPEGPAGPEGPQGPRGEKGDKGDPGICVPPAAWTLRPYDLTLPAHLVTLRGTVPVPGGHFVMVYSAPLKAAALIDPRTGLAQIVPIDPKFHGNVVADGFRAITPTFFEWTAGDVTWGQKWHAEFPWVPMPGWVWR